MKKEKLKLEVELGGTCNTCDRPLSSCFCFNFQIKDDSLVSSSKRYSFKEGDIITIVPGIKFKNEDFVLAYLKEEKLSIVRQYVHKNGKQCLEALNSSYPPIIIDSNVDLIGVVKKHDYINNKGLIAWSKQLLLQKQLSGNLKGNNEENLSDLLGLTNTHLRPTVTHVRTILLDAIRQAKKHLQYHNVEINGDRYKKDIETLSSTNGLKQYQLALHHELAIHRLPRKTIELRRGIKLKKIKCDFSTKSFESFSKDYPICSAVIIIELAPILIDFINDAAELKAQLPVIKDNDIIPVITECNLAIPYMNTLNALAFSQFFNLINIAALTLNLPEVQGSYKNKKNSAKQKDRGNRTRDETLKRANNIYASSQAGQYFHTTHKKKGKPNISKLAEEISTKMGLTKEYIEDILKDLIKKGELIPNSPN